MDGRIFHAHRSELAVIRAMAAHADVTITLPELDGPNLRGFAEPAVQSFSAPTVDREAEEIARRILARVEAGTAFRESGSLSGIPNCIFPRCGLRSRGSGFPRDLLPDALHEHSLVRYLPGGSRLC